ncbi:MAG: hypothetical protein ACRC6V_05635 [Bacteroidales bacterium]
MATNQGDQYNNKYILPIAEGWDLESINLFLADRGLTFHNHSTRFSEQTMDRFARDGRFFVTYTHIARDEPNAVRTAAVIPSEINWYTERGWESVPRDNFKAEIPY